MTNCLKQISLLLLSAFFFISCNGQTQTQAIVNEIKTIPAGHPKLVKTLGSTAYDNVHCGLLDKAGNLWFGTTGEGVYRYDGKLFTQFTMKDGLSSNTVWSILEDEKGNIWFGTADGASRFDSKKFTPVPVAVKNGKNFFPANSSNSNPTIKNAVWSMMQDKTGKFWFGTSEGVYCYNERQPSGELNGEVGVFTRFPGNDSIINKNHLHLKVIEAIVEDKSGATWFGSSANEGICHFDGKALTNPITMGYYGRVMAVLEDKAGNIWFGTGNQGAVRYDGRTFTNVTSKAGITTWVYDIIEDKKGNLWFATELGSGESGEDGGVWRYDPSAALNASGTSPATRQAGFTVFTTKEGLIHNGVFCIVEDKEGNLWFGTRNTGLCRYDGKTFTRFSE